MFPRSQRWLVGALLAVALLVIGHAWVLSAHAQRLSRLSATESASALSHRLIRPEFAADGNLWLIFAERLAAGESLRIRDTHVDNAPAGREVHWSNGYAWWLALCGKFTAALCDEPLPLALERASLWANLPLFLVGLSLVGWWVGRRYGALAGGLALLALLGNRALYGGFWPGNVDHHGIVVLALVGCVLGAAALVDGLPSGASEPIRSRLALWSGVWGGVAMWISAATALPVIAALGLGALVAARYSSAQAATTNRAESWRRWGRSGALTSLAFYFLEYFPDHLGWRLEVNHPLYAAAWWAGAELLAVLVEQPRTSNSRPTSLARTTLWTLPLILLPLALIAFFPAQVFLPADRIVAGLHGLILEFLPLWVRLPIEGPAANYETLFVIPGFYALGFWLWGKRPEDRALIAFAVVPLAVSHVMGIWQARWTGGAIFGELILDIAAARAFSTRTQFSRLLVPALALIVTLPDLWPRTREAIELADPAARMPGDDRQLFLRHCAAAMRTRLPANAVVWSTPNTSLDLVYYGGFRTLGTLYWENRAGLQAMSSLAAATTDAEAEALIRRHGVTHLALFTDDDVLDEIVRVAHPSGTPEQRNATFAVRVFRAGAIPAWLRALPDLTTATPTTGPRLELFAVDFTQSVAEAQFHLAEVLARRGATERASVSFARSAALGYAPAALRQAEYLLAAQRWSEAVAMLEQAIAGASPAARYRLLTQAGELLAEGRQAVPAARFFERALHENVTDTRAANGLAWILATSLEPALQQREFALRLAQQSTRLDPSEAAGWSALAAARAATGDLRGALQALERATQAGASGSLQDRISAQRAAYLAGRLIHD